MQSPQRVADLLQIQIDWIKRSGEPEWYAFLSGEMCELILNDFPNEPLYTLKWRDESVDLDDAPACWVIPR